MGVRMSLGASRRSILKTMLWHSCFMTILGLAIGDPMAVLLTLCMSHVLFDVVTVNMAAFMIIFLILGGTGMLAGLIPALRGAHMDPMTILRHE